MSYTNDARSHSFTAINVPETGVVNSEPSFLWAFFTNTASIIHEPESKRVLCLLAVNVLVTGLLLMWCVSTNSIALTAFTYLTVFDVFYLITSLVTLWVSKQKPTPAFSFGYERFEVLAVFSSTVLAMLGSLFIVKESVERMIFQPEIHIGRLMAGTCVGLVWHLLVTYSVRNVCFNRVIEASTSSWLQEHVSDVSQSLCHMMPGLSKLLLPRINPLALIGSCSALALLLVNVLIEVNGYHGTDTWAAVWIAMMMCGTMFPMSVYSGKILLQTTPPHLLGQLDKCLREAGTLDGVLEFRHEHFWTLTFGTMAGSVGVRVRRDADEQLVLAHVSHRLSALIPTLTVNIFKDDWTRSAAYQLLTDSSLRHGPSPVLPSYAPRPASHIHPAPATQLRGLTAKPGVLPS